MDLGVEWAKGFLEAALGMVPVIGIAFAVLPQGTFPGASKATPIAGGPVRQGIIALRPVAVLMPLMIYMLGSENNIDPRLLYYSEAWDAEDNLRSMLRSERFTHLVELMEMAAEPPSLDFRTIAETQGLEFAWQARRGKNKMHSPWIQDKSHLLNPR